MSFAFHACHCSISSRDASLSQTSAQGSQDSSCRIHPCEMYKAGACHHCTRGALHFVHGGSPMVNTPLHNPPAAPSSSFYLDGLAPATPQPISAVVLTRDEKRQLVALLLCEMAADISENPLDSPMGWVRDRLRFVEMSRSGIANRERSLIAPTYPLEMLDMCLSRALKQLANSL